ncbi:hypothetical protein EFY79_18100 [Hanamia caeni]|jgi:hypothetical protein|uniref:Uncharacterized protein n=1 Tax=Hanamia caeni TaxID=2294116 RepID=A0A3M9N788_9BACT|nr:hypothetical protein [Hanamia caeni]RNI33670.1 hypothetical protein EFY79_18100 [Hanamia caeni]
MSNEESAEEKLESIANTTDLQTAIKRLERRKFILEEGLKEHFHDLTVSLKPKNIIKNTIAELQESTTLRQNVLKVALGLGAGYFSRRLLVTKSAGVVKKALGAVLQYGITNFIAKKGDDENDEYPKKKNVLRRILSI